MPNNKYKKTSAGKIPEEWEVVKVGDITKEHKQGFYTSDNYSEEGINLVRITDLQNPKISYSTMPKIIIDDEIFKQFNVEIGDFLIARSGAIGRYGIVENSIPCVFASYIIRFRFDKSRVDNLYFGKLFESFYISNELRKITQGATNKNINAQNIKRIKIPLPPLPEQRRIAEVLGTVDSAIQKVGGAIESTERLKKGMMQRLVTRGIGHERFKESEVGRVPQEWEVVRLGDEKIVDLIMGQSPTSSTYNDKGIGLPFLQGNANFGETYPAPMLSCSQPIKIAEKNDILLSVRAPVGDINIASSKSCIGRGLAAIRPKNDKLNYLFLFYYLKFGSRKFESLSMGSTFKAIRKQEVVKFQIPLPPLPEQRRIAEILSTVDKKLALSRRRREKLERMKKGLMNELLTGRKRVKVN